MSSLENVLDWRGREMLDPDGTKVGQIEEIYVDQETDEPEWALVNTGLFGGKSTFVPLRAATEQSDGIRVPFAKDHVKDAPGMDPSGELTRDEEARLYRHYGMDYGDSSSEGEARDRDAGLAATAGTSADDRTRSETRDVDRSPRERATGERRGERDLDDRGVEPAQADESESRGRSAGAPGGERLRVADERGGEQRPRLRRFVVTEVVTASGTQEVERKEVGEAELRD